MLSCEHCLLPLPPSPSIRENDGERVLFFCCSGCRSIYRLLHSEGLAEFYRRRTGWDPGPPEACRPDTEGLAGSVRENEGLHEANLAISGIRCASCVWVIERYLGRKKGVAFARVNHATGRATIRWDPGAVGIGDIARWIGELGYTPHPHESGAAEEAGNREKRDLLLRFGTAAFLSMQVMTFTAALYAGYFQGIESPRRRGQSSTTWKRWTARSRQRRWPHETINREIQGNVPQLQGIDSAWPGDLLVKAFHDSRRLPSREMGRKRLQRM
jgi:Cu2+-exporting ATPase